MRLDDEKDLLERLAQKKKLDEFVGKWFHDQAEGTLVAAFIPSSRRATSRCCWKLICIA